MRRIWPAYTLIALFAASCGDSEGAAPTWQAQFGSQEDETAFAVASLNDGSVVTAFSTTGSIGESNNGNRDVVLMRLDSSGDELWTVQFGGPANDSPLGVSVSSDGHIYVGGYTEGDLAGPNQGSADVWVAQFGQDGAEQWRRQFGGEQWDRGFDVTAFDDGVYVSGYTASVLDSASDREGFDGFAARFEADGTQSWIRQFGTDSTDWGQGSALAPDGGIYVTGYTEGDFGGPNLGDKDAFVVRLGPDGNLIWVRQFGSEGLDWTQGVSTADNGGALVAGSTEGDVAAGNAGGRDALVAAFHADGTQRFATQFGTSELDTVFDVRQVGDRIVATGSTAGSLPDTIGAGDAMLLWLDSEGEIVDRTIIGSAALDEGTGLDVTGSESFVYVGYTYGDVAAKNAGGADIIIGVLAG